MIKQAFKGLWTSALQWIINVISSTVFEFKKREAINLSQTYHAKYYVIQSGYFNWAVFRAKDIEVYKKIGAIKPSVTAKELEGLSAYVADPMRRPNIKKPENKD